MGGEFVGDDAGAHVFFVGQAKGYARGNVASMAVPYQRYWSRLPEVM